MAGIVTKCLLILLLLETACARMVINEAALAADVECPGDNNGVPAAAIIDVNDVNYAAYKDYSDILDKWMNLSINPCEDFYGYACQKGQANKVTGTMSESELFDIQTQIDAYKNNSYFTYAPKPLKQLKHLFDKCVKSDATSATLSSSLKSKLQTLKSETGVNFPMLYQTERPTALNAANLGSLLGWPINDFGNTGSLVPITVEADWKTPDEVPARVTVDQVFPMFISEVYDDWKSFKPTVVASIEKSMLTLANSFGLRISLPALKADASAVAEMEYALRNYRTDDTTRRQKERSYNLQTLGQLQSASPGYNWINLIKAALARANAPENITSTLKVIVQEPDMITKLSKDIAAKKTPFDTATVANYVYYRATEALLGTAPPTTKLLLRSEEYANEMAMDKYKRVPSRRSGGLKKRPVYEKIAKHLDAARITEKEYDCYDFIGEKMNRASDRVFVDQVYPTPESRTDIRKEVRAVAQSIFNGFRTQINMLNWMSPESKQGAYKKIENIQLNIAYSDWITDDAQLTAYYDGLSISDASNTLQTYDAIQDFYLNQQVENFRLNKPRDRTDFGHDPVGITNANYQASFHSITIFSSLNTISLLAGILHAPIYDPQYPAAVNFGGLGTVSGHELTHGFDDEGVQWDSIGALNGWMDGASSDAFTDMANCVVNEYSGFCPEKDLCLNGANTQGENIADNGGIQAAYKAFKSTESYNGPDPRLPGFGSKFTNDQLFFLSFANVWCDAPETDDQYENAIETDPHSPALYRILGTIQNFPAFRSAFNCPVGSTYAPQDHCDVWTSPPLN